MHARPSILISYSAFTDGDPLWQASISQRDGVSPALAWLDLVLLAAPTDREQQVGEHSVPLKRGEVLVSVRFLTRRWNWGGASGTATGKVQRFLALLIEIGRVEKVRATNYGLVMRIVDYDSYSPSAQPEKPQPKPQSKQKQKAPDQEQAAELILFPQDEVKRSEYPPEFEAFWQAYPRREGGNSKKAAFKKWVSLRKRGVPAADLLQAARGYAAEQERLGNVGTRFVKQAVTFLGPDEHWKQYLTADATLAQDPNKSPAPPRTPPRTLDGYSAAQEAERLAQERLARLKLVAAD